MEMSKIKTSGITFKDKLGYTFGDMGCNLTLGLVGTFLQMFYTDILGVDFQKIFILLVISRVWDAINDPLCGVIIDRRKTSKNGKFRPYLKWFSVPFAVSSILMFVFIPGRSTTFYLAFAFITYIFYDMMNTVLNIPYGSLASVITDDEGERSSLSVFRSVGAGLGGLPASILLPLFVYSTAAGSDVKYLDEKKLLPAVILFASLSVVAYLLCYRMTTERVPHPPVPPKADFRGTLFTLLKNRPFVVLGIVSMLQIAVTLYTQTQVGYLFKDYFKKPGLVSLFTICSYLPMALLLPLLGPLVKRFGKKELCAVGLFLSFAVNLLAFFLKLQNPYIYLVFGFLSGLGFTFLTMQVWALVTDVIDYQELLSGKREEGTSYAFYSFVRKLGHTIAGGGGLWALSRVGYQVNEGGIETAVVQSAEAIKGIYNVATAIPAVLYLLMFLLLAFAYPLSKKALGEVSGKLAVSRAQEVAGAAQ
ncbi:MAG: glycoside-pentoside-hexuronide (GPH):cation symporter [Oscillospiraceae bacterium]|jgi:GPH family glycoside/pentoside/hexuronide:cation symporter|nr:glycoside-pentoside-hexuronide (GPH):cation symporter [Oscillospiraceae bacterium]